MRELAGHLRDAGADADQIAALLVLGPVLRQTWELAAELGADIDAAYWERCNPTMWVRADDNDFEPVLRKLCNAGRPRMALAVGHFDLKKIEGGLLVEMLEQFSYEGEPGGPLPSSWDICEAIDQLEATSGIERRRLAMLEFRLFKALGFKGGNHAKSLYWEITNDPRVFAEFICMVYKTHNRVEEVEISEQQRTLAGHAGRILHDCHTLPGASADGTFDSVAFKEFIHEARRLCAEADRLGACDGMLGQILAYSPADSDGVWPFGPARDVLDDLGLERMREGFQVGTHNKRGVVTKSYAEGGGQERSLGATFKRHAAASTIRTRRWPRCWKRSRKAMITTASVRTSARE